VIDVTERYVTGGEVEEGFTDTDDGGMDSVDSFEIEGTTTVVVGVRDDFGVCVKTIVIVVNERYTAGARDEERLDGFEGDGVGEVERDGKYPEDIDGGGVEEVVDEVIDENEGDDGADVWEVERDGKLIDDIDGEGVEEVVGKFEDENEGDEKVAMREDVSDVKYAEDVGG
jgi:hypothetical protein